MRLFGARGIVTPLSSRYTPDNCACFCAVTMLTLKLTTEIIENHSEFCGAANTCNKFVSYRL